jgi:hypothetical protein
MIFEPEVLAIVIGFMVLSNRLVAALITPIFDKYQVDKFWLMYVAWVMAGVLVFLADVNLFAEFIPNLLIGKILTAVVAGGGGNLLHDLTDQSDEIVFLAPEE